VNQTQEFISFKHTGFLGDLIYSMVGMRQIFRLTGKKARIYMWLDRPHFLYEGAADPYGGVGFTAQLLEMSKGFIEDQDYVESIQEWKGEKIDFDLDIIRGDKRRTGMPYGDNRRWYMYVFPEMYCSISEPWLNHPDADRKGIVIQRTLRTRNSHISYHFLNRYPNVKVVGFLEEFEVLHRELPNAEYVQIESIQHMTQLIAESQLFIGSQSSGMAIAEGMGHPRILEAYAPAQSVQIATPNGSDFLNQIAFEHLVNQAIK